MVAFPANSAPDDSHNSFANNTRIRSGRSDEATDGGHGQSSRIGLDATATTTFPESTLFGVVKSRSRGFVGRAKSVAIVGQHQRGSDGIE